MRKKRRRRRRCIKHSKDEKHSLLTFTEVQIEMVKKQLIKGQKIMAMIQFLIYQQNMKISLISQKKN